jgi:hypothetical protein
MSYIKSKTESYRQRLSPNAYASELNGQQFVQWRFIGVCMVPAHYKATKRILEVLSFCIYNTRYGCAYGWDMCVYMYVCIYVCMYVCMYVSGMCHLEWTFAHTFCTRWTNDQFHGRNTQVHHACKSARMRAICVGKRWITLRNGNEQKICRNNQENIRDVLHADVCDELCCCWDQMDRSFHGSQLFKCAHMCTSVSRYHVL